MNVYNLNNRIDNIIPYISGKKVALYPYGKMGNYIKKYLEEKHHLLVDVLIDNYKDQKDTKCITIKEVKYLNYDEFIFLISSDSIKYYDEIRKEIRKYVADKQIIDLFPEKPKKQEINKFMRKMLYPHGKEAFLRKIRNSSDIKILDVGCGNRSAEYVKSILSKVYYVGLDVGDYNQTNSSKKYIDEYVIVDSKEFAKKIEEYKDCFDVVISSHNIEHCEEPERVLHAMISSLKIGGKLYMAFPSEASQYFPGGRKGCLNFYDDSSHRIIPDWEQINSILQNRNMKIVFKTKRNQPYLMNRIGKINETKSAELKEVLAGTWEYYGFESIIWAKRYAI